ncbi:MAG: bifunctional nuclease family protein [Bacteroides sp.]
MDKKVELKVVGLSGMAAQEGAYMLVLQEVDGERQISIVTGAYEAQAVALRVKGIAPERPLTHDLFTTFASAFNIKLKETYIYKMEDGMFFSYLCFEQNGEIIQVEARVSDSIPLALCFGSPIHISEDILNGKDVHTKSSHPAFAPLNYTEDATLKAALKNAVDTEQFEFAAILRNELLRREAEAKKQK